MWRNTLELRLFVERTVGKEKVFCYYQAASLILVFFMHCYCKVLKYSHKLNISAVSEEKLK
jgi:hypothetical protein